jgi:hypothetical protein
VVTGGVPQSTTKLKPGIIIWATLSAMSLEALIIRRMVYQFDVLRAKTRLIQHIRPV